MYLLINKKKCELKFLTLADRPSTAVVSRLWKKQLTPLIIIISTNDGYI